MLAKTGIKFGETSTRTNSQPTSPLCMESLTVILRYQTLSSLCSQIECFSTTRAKKILSDSKAQQPSQDRSIYFQLLATCNGRLSIRIRRNSNRKASDYVRIRITYYYWRAHTAAKVAGRKIADIKAITIVDLVSRVDWCVSCLMSLFSWMLCSVMSRTAWFNRLLLSACRTSWIFWTWCGLLPDGAQIGWTATFTKDETPCALEIKHVILAEWVRCWNRNRSTWESNMSKDVANEESGFVFCLIRCIHSFRWTPTWTLSPNMWQSWWSLSASICKFRISEKSVSISPSPFGPLMFVRNPRSRLSEPSVREVSQMEENQLTSFLKDSSR